MASPAKAGGPARRAAPDDRVVVGRIGAAHGIKGAVRMKAFTADPADVAAYGPLQAADGRRFEIEALRPAGASPDMLVVQLKGVSDRNQAEALNGTELFVGRADLPPPDADEFYYADLIGLDAVTPDGAALGTVIDVANYGAGDLLEIAPRRGETLLVPFTKAVVPEVDLAGGRIVVAPPQETEAGEEASEESR